MSQNKSSAAQLIENLGLYTKYTIDNSDYIKQAFTLGLWYDAFPDYVFAEVERTHWWTHVEDFGRKDTTDEDAAYPNLMRFAFIAETGDSWHQCYRDLRSRGWQRLLVNRKSGNLIYLLKNQDESKPLEYSQIHLILSITIKTCKQVQVGVETKEVPIMKTVCEDLIELVEEVSQVSEASIDKDGLPLGYGDAPGGEVIPLVVVNDIEALQARRGAEDDIPF